MENIWRIIRSFNFDELKDPDMFCSICKQLLINAYCSPCGCRYCFDCISNYLEKNPKCPGNNEYCKTDIIQLNKNIFIDHPMNIKISKLIVKCPEELCQHEEELRTIDHHIQKCNYRIVYCPYFNIGCKTSKISQANISEHLKLESENHGKLLLNCIEHLKKTVVKLEEENMNLKNEICEMKLNSESKQAEILELQRKLDRNTKNNIDQSNLLKISKQADNNERNKEIERMILKFQKMENTFLESIQKTESIKQIKEEITELRLKYEEQAVNIQQFKNKYQQIESKFIIAMEERENKEKQLMSKIDETNENNRKRIMEITINQNKLNLVDFLWKIENLNDKIKNAKIGINTKLFSDSFYTHKHGYKMCLRVDPYGVHDYKGTHLSVLFYLLKGEYDDVLEWPFKYDVTIALIDQSTRLAHTSTTIKYNRFNGSKDWNKPIGEKNGSFGKIKFIKLDELLKNNNLVMNNQIFIKCSVNIL